MGLEHSFVPHQLGELSTKLLALPEGLDFLSCEMERCAAYLRAVMVKRGGLPMEERAEITCKWFIFLFIVVQSYMQNQNAIFGVGGVSSPSF